MSPWHADVAMVVRGVVQVVMLLMDDVMLLKESRHYRSGVDVAMAVG